MIGRPCKKHVPFSSIPGIPVHRVHRVHPRISLVSIKCPFWQLCQVIDNHGQVIAMSLGNHLLNRLERTCGADDHSPFWVKVHLSSTVFKTSMTCLLISCMYYIHVPCLSSDILSVPCKNHAMKRAVKVLIAINIIYHMHISSQL